MTIDRVLLLRPRGVAEPSAAAVGETGLWPVFVMVVTEPTDPAARLALPLFEMLDRPKHTNELSARCRAVELLASVELAGVACALRVAREGRPGW